MIRYKSIQQILIQVVGSHLEPLSYNFVGMPDGSRSKVGSPFMLFFRKNLWEDVFGFVSYKFMNQHIEPQNDRERPQSFDVGLWRNKGVLPHHGFGSNEYENWLNMPLAQLMWTVLDVKTYPWQYHTWGFATQDELAEQFQDSVEKLIEYGIPWLENPESQNPYPSR